MKKKSIAIPVLIIIAILIVYFALSGFNFFRNDSSSPTFASPSNPPPTTEPPTTEPPTTEPPTTEPTEIPRAKFMSVQDSDWYVGDNRYYGVTAQVKNIGGPGYIRVYVQFIWGTTSTLDQTKYLLKNETKTFEFQWNYPLYVNTTTAIQTNYWAEAVSNGAIK